MTRIRYSRSAAAYAVVAAAMLLPAISAVTDCTVVSGLFSACSSFVMYGSPDPIPESPCCVAMSSLSSVADSEDNRRAVCRCLMDILIAYSTNATAIATLPGFCGVSLGFTIDPNTDCEYIDQFANLKGK